MRDRTGEVYSVGEEVYYADDDMTEMELPEWAREFVYRCVYVGSFDIGRADAEGRISRTGTACGCWGPRDPVAFIREYKTDG